MEQHSFCYDKLAPEMSLVGKGSLNAMQNVATYRSMYPRKWWVIATWWLNLTFYLGGEINNAKVG